jgi:hypothetical protein
MRDQRQPMATDTFIMAILSVSTTTLSDLKRPLSIFRALIFDSSVDPRGHGHALR